MEDQNNIPEGKFKRGSIIGATGAKAGLKKLEYLSKKPFLSEEQNRTNKDRNDEDIAKIIFKAISSLKGAPLKFAQILSMEIELLPEAYQKELAKSAYQVPSINRALIRKIIKQELEDWPEKVFKSFEASPFAAASLGQVHRAVSQDGHELAVKVQYPGVAAGVKSDIDMLKMVLKMTPYSKMLESPIDEIKMRISEELDYFKEAENTKYFYDNLDMENVIVPKVYEDLSTEAVITTSRLEGLHLSEWLKTSPSQEIRNHYGQLICDLLSASINEHMLIHADPNIGNFLFRDDGRLGLIDFGCVKKIEDYFIQNMELFLNAVNEKNSERFKEILNSLGIQYKKNINGDALILFSEWIEWITRPMRSDLFDFGNNRDYFAESGKFIPKIYNYIERYDGSMVYFGRTVYGIYRILHQLGANVKLDII
ncbi:MAG: AarF/ABC1/UbiB kinase family protein [Spirochaetes bacterium]|nr:AarF/ABC1/UbiB kinase family protein [Spirochaetota bacterium]